MLFVLVTVVVIAFVLFIISFFVDDKVKKLEDQFEQFSITSMQDTYQLKRKIKNLEENSQLNQKQDSEAVDDEVQSIDIQKDSLLVQKINHLHEQGYSNDEISKITNLNHKDIVSALHQS